MFSWDPRKAIANFEKHRVSFEEAATIFADMEGLDWEDLTHSNHEIRYKRIGLSKCFTRSLYSKEVPRWQRNDPHHQREAGESQRAAGLFRIVRLISLIYRNPRMKNWVEPEE